MIVLEMKCPQLSKPEATAARNENSIGDRMEKKPWEKPGSVGGPVPLRPDESVVCSNWSKVRVHQSQNNDALICIRQSKSTIKTKKHYFSLSKNNGMKLWSLLALKRSFPLFWRSWENRLLLTTAVRPASTLKNAVILAATLFSGARVYYALR